MKNFIVLLFLSALLCACTQTKPITSNPTSIPNQVHINGMYDNLRVLKVTDDNNHILCYDTIIGDVVILNKIGKEEVINIQSSVASRSNTTGMPIAIEGSEPVTSYLIWLDYAGTMQSRIWNFGETVSTRLIEN